MNRELLEMAAKAAGIVLKPIEISYSNIRGERRFIGFMADPSQCPRGWFDPLKDDGDRYRLAKKLDIKIHFGPAYVTYVVSGMCKILRWPEDVKNDAYAITQAAAEIGAAMQ